MALRAAELAGLRIDRDAYAGAREWIRRVTNARGVVGYESPGDDGSVIAGVNEKWKSHPTMTAIGLLIKLCAEKSKSDPILTKYASILVKDLPIYDTEHKTVDFYYWHHAALAIFGFDAPDGLAWRAINAKMKAALVPHQVEAGCAAGSWDPAPDKWSPVGGRVAATALNVLTLEVYYRWPKD
jgi:hypothetical protein